MASRAIVLQQKTPTDPGAIVKPKAVVGQLRSVRVSKRPPQSGRSNPYSSYIAGRLHDGLGEFQPVRDHRSHVSQRLTATPDLVAVKTISRAAPHRAAG